MKTFEPLWYELSPYLYTAIGVITIFKTNLLGAVFGSLLIATSLLILKIRWSYRSSMEKMLTLSKPLSRKDYRYELGSNGIRSASYRRYH